MKNMDLQELLYLIRETRNDYYAASEAADVDSRQETLVKFDRMFELLEANQAESERFIQCAGCGEYAYHLYVNQVTGELLCEECLQITPVKASDYCAKCGSNLESNEVTWCAECAKELAYENR